MSAKKKSNWLWPTTVFVLLTLLYVASFGPVADRLDSGNVAAQWRGPLFVFYRPLIWIVNEGPQPLRRVMFKVMLSTGYRMTCAAPVVPDAIST